MTEVAGDFCQISRATNDSLELTCDGLVFRPGGVKDSHPLNTTENGDKRQHLGLLGS